MISTVSSVTHSSSQLTASDRRSLRKRWLYLLPAVFATYSVAYLDRANFGIGAAAGMAATRVSVLQSELHMELDRAALGRELLNGNDISDAKGSILLQEPFQLVRRGNEVRLILESREGNPRNARHHW